MTDYKHGILLTQEHDKYSLAADGARVTDEGIQRDDYFRSSAMLDETASARLSLRSQTRLIGEIRLFQNNKL
jgi:hypothetical protein